MWQGRVKNNSTWQTNYPINKENSLDTLVTVCGWLKHCHMLTTTFLRRKLYLFNFFLMKRYRFLCNVLSKIYAYSWVVLRILHFRYTIFEQQWIKYWRFAKTFEFLILRKFRLKYATSIGKHISINHDV